jgi:hypothetical protein
MPRINKKKSAAGYVLRTREPDWHEHRVIKDPDSDINLHVFSSGSTEIERMLRFRDHLCSSISDRQLYEQTKRNDPLGLTIAPSGHIFTVNGNDGNLVEVTPQGRQVETVTLNSTGNPPGSGTLFGLAVAPEGVYFVDDGSNTLNLLVDDA